jgi:L-asparaginase II
MVAGSGEFDTRLMETGSGALIAKGGAEGYQGIGLLPGAFGGDSPGNPPPGIGIAIKVSDGDPGGTVRHALALGLLKSLGALTEAQLRELAVFGPGKTLKNYRGYETGAGVPLVEFAPVV